MRNILSEIQLPTVVYVDHIAPSTLDEYLADDSIQKCTIERIEDYKKIMPIADHAIVLEDVQKLSLSDVKQLIYNGDYFHCFVGIVTQLPLNFSHELDVIVMFSGKGFKLYYERLAFAFDSREQYDAAFASLGPHDAVVVDMDARRHHLPHLFMWPAC